MSSLVCTSCEIQIEVSDRNAHYRCEWHRYNVKRRVAGLQPIPEQLFNQKLAALRTMQDGEKESQQAQTCTICCKTFNSASAFEKHLASKRHQSRAASRSSRASRKTSTNSTTSSLASSSSPAPATQQQQQQQQQVRASNSPSLAQEEKAGDTTADHANADDDYEFDESKIIPLGTCLFCNKNCKTVKKSLDHMLKKHGFFIPFIEYLTDLEKLLEYLGAKVGVGKVCLFCNGKRGRAAYKSLHAVQQHMVAKNHCKLMMEGEDEDEEFLDFYSFPQADLPPWLQGGEGDSEEEGGDGGDGGDEGEGGEGSGATEAAAAAAAAGAESGSPGQERNQNCVVHVAAPVRRRHLAGMNPAGELIMTDGAIIGHRALNRAYKQNVRPVTRQEEIWALMGDYRKLTLDGYNKRRPETFNQFQHKYQQRRVREQNKYMFRANNIKHFVDSTES